jgi:hypothetical protein
VLPLWLNQTQKIGTRYRGDPRDTRVNLRVNAGFAVPSPPRGEGQDEGNGREKVLLTPLTLALSPIVFGSLLARRCGEMQTFDMKDDLSRTGPATEIYFARPEIAVFLSF